MAFVSSSRVKETSTTTGTGNLTLAGAVDAKHRAFSVVCSNNDTFFYSIEHQSADEYEFGYGTYVSATPAIARTSVIGSSNSNNAVNFSAGVKEIFISPLGEVTQPVNPGRNDFRLTGTTATPVTSSDVTAIGTLYWTPYQGPDVALYTGSFWKNYRPGEVSLSLASHIKGVCYDIFAYDNAGTGTLESVAWKKVTASNNPTAGSSKQIDLADTATLVVGMDVTVRDGSNSEIARITTVTTNTSIVVDTLANSYTTPDVYGYRARATALVLQDGVYVKNGATGRRYVGTIAITATTAETEDSAAHRGIWNYYNRVSRSAAGPIETTNQWDYSTAAWRQSNGSKTNQFVYVCGVLEDAVRANATAISTTSGATQRTRYTGIGANRTTTNDAQQTGYARSATTFFPQGVSFYTGYPPIGRNYIAWLEFGGGADTQTWYGDSGAATEFQTGMTGQVMA